MTMLKNAARLLCCFGRECPDITVSEAARRLDMPKANASRLLKAMRDAGMLEVVGGTHRHRPGRLMLDLASLRYCSPLLRRGGDVVAEISRTFGHTGCVSLLDGREVKSVADFPGSNTLRVFSDIGRRLPAHLSATGRTLLARRSDAEVMALYEGLPTMDDLLARLADVRRTGYAFSAQETAPGVDGIAVAVVDPVTEEAISLCIAYPHTLVSEGERGEIVTALARGAARIAGELGDKAFVFPAISQQGRSA